MLKFKITVIGTITRDTITFPSGTTTESFGGILYNISALSGLGGNRVEIYPVCNLGYDVYEDAIKILKDYRNVKLDGVTRVESKNNHVFLSLDKKHNKKEILKNRVPVLKFDQIKPFLDGHVFLVNFISGFDIGLEDLKRIRNNANAQVFIDIHSLTLGRDRSGKRYFKTPKRWREYIKLADIVQTNLIELEVICGRKLRLIKDISEYGNYLLSLGPDVLLITLGEKGALMIFKKGDKMKLEKCSGMSVRGFKDTTGCGDIFSAGFLISYHISNDLTQSLYFANRVATEKCKISGVEGVANLMRDIAITEKFKEKP